jgi:hypothetical protein
MNTSELQAKISDIVTLLEVAMREVEEIKAAREALEKSSFVVSEREKGIRDREVAVSQKEKDVEAQKNYVDEQSRTAQNVLNKIVLEKEELKKITEQNRITQDERVQFDIDTRAVNSLKTDKENLAKEREEFEAGVALFGKEKLAIKEAQELLLQREANIKIKEDRQNKIEQMTGL